MSDTKLVYNYHLERFLRLTNKKLLRSWKYHSTSGNKVLFKKLFNSKISASDFCAMYNYGQVDDKWLSALFADIMKYDVFNQDYYLQWLFPMVLAHKCELPLINQQCFDFYRYISDIHVIRNHVFLEVYGYYKKEVQYVLFKSPFTAPCSKTFESYEQMIDYLDYNTA